MEMHRMYSVYPHESGMVSQKTEERPDGLSTTVLKIHY